MDLWNINHWKLFNAKSIFKYTNSSTSKNSVYHILVTAWLLLWTTVSLFGMCHFLPVHHFGMACLAGRRSIYNIGNNANEGVLCIPQSSCITGTPPWDCLDSYPGNSWGHLTPLQRCSQCILQPEPTGQYTDLVSKVLYLRKFSLASVHTLDVKTVLFQPIQLSINMQFKCLNISV